MAPSRAPRRPYGNAFFLITLLLGVLLLFVQPATSSPPEQQNQEAEDLICHTDNPADCYPRLFQPTDEFQPVRPDQDIPPGLHVRLDMETGQKEAKINVPDEIDPSLEGLPVDNSVVIVEQEGEGEPHVEPQIPPGAPEYEPVGQIKGPPVEAATFHEGLATIKRLAGAAHEPEFRGALTDLLDISSDIYYGLKLAEDAEVVRVLLCLMTGGDDAAGDATTLDNRQAAARILGSAIQNNAKALAEVEKSWADSMASTCPGGSTKLETAFYKSFLPASDDDKRRPSPEEYAGVVSRVGSTVFAAKGLVQSAAIRDDFLAKGGMGNLLEVLAQGDERWAPTQRKVGHLLLDTFLDPEAGATLGVWPQGQADGDDVCAQGDAVRDGCVDYYVKTIMAKSKGERGHWSEEVYDRLRAARKGMPGNGDTKVEL